jgi:hypothetical protein
MTGSLPFDEKRGCPTGFHKRASFTSRKGHRVPPRCVKSQTVYTESRKNYTRRVLGRQTARLKAMGKSGTRRQRCPNGKVERRGYVRKFAPDVIQRGYTVKRASGRVYRVHPEKQAVYVKPSCIKDRGITGKIAPGEGFGPLRKGELKKHGYVYQESRDARYSALRKAVKEFGALGVFRKLDVVAKLSKRTVPAASRVFKADREWIRREFSLKAPQ